MNNLDNINHYRSCDAGVHIYKRLKNSKYSLYSSYICEDGNYPMPYYDATPNFEVTPFLSQYVFSYNDKYSGNIIVPVSAIARNNRNLQRR